MLILSLRRVQSPLPFLKRLSTRDRENQRVAISLMFFPGAKSPLPLPDSRRESKQIGESSDDLNSPSSSHDLSRCKLIQKPTLRSHLKKFGSNLTKFLVKLICCCVSFSLFSLPQKISPPLERLPATYGSFYFFLFFF